VKREEGLRKTGGLDRKVPYVSQLPNRGAQLTKAGTPRKELELRYKDLPAGGVKIVPIEPKKKPKKDGKGAEEKAGRFSIWRLPWDADAAVPFTFPDQTFPYRIISASVQLGPIAVFEVTAYFTLLDGAGNAVAAVDAPTATGTPDDSLITFAPNLPRRSPILSGIPPWPYTVALPDPTIVLPRMKWTLALDDGGMGLAGQSVVGVSVLTETLTDEGKPF